MPRRWPSSSATAARTRRPSPTRPRTSRARARSAGRPTPRRPLSSDAMAEQTATEDLGTLLEGLNEPQREAVTYGDGPLLILAGAGSGKTRVLTHRIAYLVRTGRVRAGEMHRANALDFDDLLFRAVNVLELFPEVRERYQAAFRHVLVDEYQDTNHAQYRWLQLLAGEGTGDDPDQGHRNLAVVGDDDQSIYSFRSADIKNILNFEDDFVDAKLIRLEQNYRSTQTILDVANAVISNNRGRKGKTLFTELGKGDPVKVRELDDEHAEARFVSGEVQRLVDEGVSREEIAVFYRTNSQSRVLEDRLIRDEIGYQVIGGTKFYERAEIKDAVAYLTVLVNPADVVGFTRIVNSPRRGIGQTSLSRVVAQANTTGESVWDTAADPTAVPGLGTAAIKAFDRFMATMRVLRERAEA